MKKIWKTYGLMTAMLLAVAAGCITGAVWPGATKLKPLGTVFINLMFCMVVPMVFASIAGAVANMGDRRKAGKIVGVSVTVFLFTGLLASALMFVVAKLYPPVLTPWTRLPSQEMGTYASWDQMLVNFFTAEDFVNLLSRKAMLPLIVFSILFGFAVNRNGGRNSRLGRGLQELSDVMLGLVKMVMYYAPVAFFGFFADLVASYGPQITADYGRAMLAYYPLCFAYLLLIFPCFAWLGGGRGGPRQMFAHIFRPAVVSLGTCSSIATIPTNLDASARSGISKEVTDLVIPLGSTMHMDGSALACVLKVAFLYGVFGMDLGWGMLVPVVLISVLSAVGTSGVPGGGYIGEYMICAIFFPEQMALAFPILVVIGNLVDPPATMINATGDYVASYLIERFVSGKDWLKKKLQNTP